MEEEDFELIMPVFQNVKDFDYYEFIKIEKAVWQKILFDLKKLEKIIENDSVTELASFYKNFFINAGDKSIAAMVKSSKRTGILANELSSWIENELQKTSFIWYLGM
jgi:hypothetical protein